MDHAARATQLDGCIAHAGFQFSFLPPEAPAGTAPLSFSANVLTEQTPADADKTRLSAQAPRLVRLTAARFRFGARLPKAGEEIIGGGHRYRISALPEPPTSATIVFVCTVTPLPA